MTWLYHATMSKPTEIDQIRLASRVIVRELGFLNKGLAGTPLPPSQVHAIIEIGNQSVKNAHELGAELGLEKSTISRLVAKLISKGLVCTKTNDIDTRVQDLTLSKNGREKFDQIQMFGRNQVYQALSELSENRRDEIRAGLTAYATALQSRDPTVKQNGENRLEIHEGYFPTILARVTEMHAEYYSALYNFGAVFECKVAAEISEFLGRVKREKNIVLSAHLDGKIVGSVFIDGEDLGNNTAHLRWFIMDERARGLGIGKKLISAAMNHVDRFDFAQTQLWTFRGLAAARRLYEDVGFLITEEKHGTQWGTEVYEQTFVRYATKD